MLTDDITHFVSLKKMVRTKLLRSTQINALYLDKEIEKTFQVIITDIIKLLPPAIVAPHTPEISVLLKLGIINYSILTHGRSFGQEMLNIKYAEITPMKKFFYCLISGGLDYLLAKCEMSVPRLDFSNIVFRWLMINGCILKETCGFINLSIFLTTGTKPQLIERLLGLNQIGIDGTNRVYPPQSKYLARELIWNGFIDILIYVIPLINFYKLKRIVKPYLTLINQPHPIRQTEKVMERKITPDTRCQHCSEKPILPHHMGCEHLFCYVCLKGNQTADSRFQCPGCEFSNSDLAICEAVQLGQK